ncbi:MAG: STAS domain-containing protein [Candidatus Omnitrophica bacterium]|nr:STAS domain-containing protein [Candidatus Omnitrophota bacterium]
MCIKQKEHDVFVVFLSGSFDSASYLDFEQETIKLLALPVKAVILDMKGVDYISSLGVGAIFKMMKSTQDQHASLLLVNLQPQIQKVFETVKALPSGVFKSVEEVDEYLSGIQKKFSK